MDETTRALGADEPLSGGDPVLLEEKSFKEPKTEILKRWPVMIKFCDVGCFIEVGCKSFAFGSIGEAMQALDRYVEDPARETNYWAETQRTINED